MTVPTLVRSLRDGGVNDGAITVLGLPLQLRAQVIEGVVDVRSPRHEHPRLLLQRLNPIVLLIADLVDVDAFEFDYVLLELLDALLEVHAPVVGDDGSIVLVAVNSYREYSRASMAVSRSCRSAEASSKCFILSGPTTWQSVRPCHQGV